MTKRLRPSGFTLIELMVVIVVAVMLVTIAAPAMNDFIVKARIRGAAEALYADLGYARAESVLRNQDVTVSITTGTEWCYGLNAGGSCNCAEANSCSIKSVDGGAFEGTSLNSNFSELVFDRVQGTITGTDGTIGTDPILFENSLGEAGVMPMAVSIKLCAPSSYAAIMGYPSCD